MCCQPDWRTRLADLRTSTALVNNGPAGLDYVPTYNATIEYRLIRTSDGAGFAIGSAKQEDSLALETAVWLALHLVARQSIAEIENHRSPLKGLPNAQESMNRTAPKTSEAAVFGPESCAWLASDIPHADAVRKVCEFAMTLPQRMPNFICDQAAARYRGKNKVPLDIITASIRYEDGSESYKDVKMNGKPVPESISQSPGLWSTGQFGSNLRSIFDANNQVVVEFIRDGSVNNQPMWIFAYHIPKQNDPLWRLHSNDQVLAPPYRGELWVDQQSGQLLHFDSVAVGIPPTFAMEAASLEIDYAEVNFADGSSFPLPSTCIVSTRYRDQEPTRNVVRFK